MRQAKEMGETMETGCIFAGHRGHYMNCDVVELACDLSNDTFGSDSPWNVRDLVDQYRDGDYDVELAPAYNVAQAVDELVDPATDWLNEHVAEEDYMFGFYDGEFYYQSVEWFAEDYYSVTGRGWRMPAREKGENLMIRRCTNGYVRRDGDLCGPIHVVGPNDHSPAHSIYDHYDPACSWCWLGYAHSEEMHASKVAAQ